MSTRWINTSNGWKRKKFAERDSDYFLLCEFESNAQGPRKYLTLCDYKGNEKAFICIVANVKKTKKAIDLLFDAMYS